MGCGVYRTQGQHMRLHLSTALYCYLPSSTAHKTTPVFEERRCPVQADCLPKWYQHGDYGRQGICRGSCGRGCPLADVRKGEEVGGTGQHLPQQVQHNLLTLSCSFGCRLVGVVKVKVQVISL